jgi:hypothetical protein
MWNPFIENIIFIKPEPENKDPTRKDESLRIASLNALAKSKRQFDYEFGSFAHLTFKRDCSAHCFF